MASDLALDAAGAEQIFSAGQRQPHAASWRPTVTERTEGWPVGLYLAALIARDSDGEALTVSGDDRYVADYLYRESLSRSCPRAISGSCGARRCSISCALRCAMPSLGEPGAQERLRRLEASSLFLVPLDRRREWYRYHGLFREFLLGELRRVEPDVIAKLHLRAADWYESNGSPATGRRAPVEHDRAGPLRPAGDGADPADLPGRPDVDRAALARRRSATPAIEEYPPLAVLAGWVAALTGQTAEAQRWAAIVDAASFDLVPADGSASFDSARAMLRAMMCPAGPEQAMADAAFAVAQEPPWSPWRDQALCLLAEAHLLTGDVDQAAALFAEAAAVASRELQHRCARLSESELALLAMDRGRWAEAAEHVRAGARRRSTSIGCTTTPPACSPSPPRPGSPCTEAT